MQLTYRWNSLKMQSLVFKYIEIIFMRNLKRNLRDFYKI